MKTQRPKYLSVDPFIPIGYTLAGPEAGIPLVICHGLGACHMQWEEERQWLAETRRVLTIDLRGHGHSAMVRNGRTKDYTVACLANDVIGVIEHCGFEYVDLLGNSLGGMVGLEIAAKRPDLLRSLITCGTAYKYRLTPLVVWIKFVTYYLLGRRLPAFIARRATTNYGMQPVVEDMYRNASRRVMHLIDRNIHTFDRLHAAVEFPGSIVVLRGDRDTAINYFLDQSIMVLADKPGFKVIDLPAVGHFTNLDRPDVFKRAITEALQHVENPNR
ncbi:hypothetical protein GCM10007385_28300 [Tateyamaria omphalii]|uniref:alpha/beta fold hydrolase n=1 Tax=Tateyamaria omphalii TaxID=299262 RepID=UPI001675BAD6|nr:alpha/beta hydrolase [Tateyamaria omphalii]GGX58078.1 hypothetical protein GCM10007385_28300 [Tateyamaria omphalii]